MLIKVCCIQDEAELEVAASAGATHVGLVGAMPSGPGPIPDARIEALIASAPSGVIPVLLTAETDAEAIAAHVRRVGAPAVQLVSSVPARVRAEVRERLDTVELLQVVHVEGPSALDESLAAADGADALLLDSGRPSAAVPELGGTGRVHDWAVSTEIVRRSPVPVLLAGGLSPDNVRDAVRTVGPAGVDVCSGLRDAGGRLRAELVHDFVRGARGARWTPDQGTG